MKSIFNKQMIGPLIFLLFGLFFYAIGSGLTIHQRSIEKHSIEAPGLVVDLQENYDSDGSTYTPVVRFQTARGQSVEFLSPYSSNPPDYSVGEQVIVVYTLEQPEKALIKGNGQLLHVIFMLVGGVIAVVGAYLTFSTLSEVTIFNLEK